MHSRSLKIYEANVLFDTHKVFQVIFMGIAHWVTLEIQVFDIPDTFWTLNWLTHCQNNLGRNIILQKSDKGQIFYWSSQTCSRIRRLFVRCLSPCSKTWKRPYFRPFQPDTEYFLPLLPYTDLVPPSTDPVPPSTNQYRPILTQYHHVSTITTLCWSSTTK